MTETFDGYRRNREKRCRVDAHQLACVAGKEVVKEHTQQRNPEQKSRFDATRPSMKEELDAAISAWVAEERNRALGREFTEEEGKSHADLAREARERGLSARIQFKAF